MRALFRQTHSNECFYQKELTKQQHQQWKENCQQERCDFEGSYRRGCKRSRTQSQRRRQERNPPTHQSAKEKKHNKG